MSEYINLSEGFQVRTLGRLRAKVFGNLYLQNGKLERVCKLLVAGHGNIRIHEMTGVDRKTVRKARHALELYTGRIFPCQCGKPAGHAGLCIYRMKEFIRRREGSPSAGLISVPDGATPSPATNLHEN